MTKDKKATIEEKLIIGAGLVSFVMGMAIACATVEAEYGELAGIALMILLSLSHYFAIKIGEMNNNHK